MKGHLLAKILIIFAIQVAPSVALGGEMDADTAKAIESEIRIVLDGYRKAMLTRDYESMIGFWSDSEDFVFAGDGRILGGIEAWKAQTTADYENTESWEIWDWQNVQILPLSQEAASATVEYRFRWVDNESVTWNSRGAWTYVFRKEGDDWKVVQTNGTHVVL
jgi:hypothetical protein